MDEVKAKAPDDAAVRAIRERHDYCFGGVFAAKGADVLYIDGRRATREECNGLVTALDAALAERDEARRRAEGWEHQHACVATAHSAIASRLNNSEQRVADLERTVEELLNGSAEDRYIRARAVLEANRGS